LERGSDKHSPRVDEQLEHDTRSLTQGAPVESRVEEFREQEGPGEDAEARSDIARFLDPSAFPADRDGLVANAESNNAPEVVLERLKAVPAGRTYDALPDVWAALGGTVEHRF
jgi:phage shock protein A